MITLNEDQQDALVEICNVGMSKAAKQLSLLLNSPIDITIPKVVLSTIDTVSNTLNIDKDKELAYVYQNISDTILGRALLIFKREHSQLLAQSVIGNMPNLTEIEIRACEQEAMVEIGNIIVSACISAISNMLSAPFQLDVPVYSEDKIENIITEHSNHISNNLHSQGQAIIIATHLETTNAHISGSLVLILTEESIKIITDLLKNLITGE